MIIFTHIPKTSGTSFASAIRHNFSNRFEFEEMEDMSNEIREPITNLFESGRKISISPDFVHSHIPFGFHRIFKSDNVSYVTMIREPLSRCLSSIRHAMKIRKTKGLVGDRKLDKLSKSHSSPKHLLLAMYENDINCNVMTKQIAGTDYRNIAIAPGMKLQAQYYMPYCHTLEKRSDRDMDAMLEKAKSNIDKYAFIGFQEAFDQSVELFCQQFGVSSREVHKQHKKTNKGFFEIGLEDDEVRDIIASMNKYDIDLYDYVRNKS